MSADFQQIVGHAPLLAGDSLPDYWCRVQPDGSYSIFLAQWPAKDLVYPVYCGQSNMQESDFSEFTFSVNEKTIKETVEFKPYQSVLINIAPDGTVKYEDISFVPKEPIVREREKQRMHF